MAQHYDVTTITLKPGTNSQALATLGNALSGRAELLACWHSEIGALNQILLIANAGDAAAGLAARQALLSEGNPFGIGEHIAGMSLDTYISFDFIEPMRPGEHGPFYEVRSYMLKPDGLAPTIERWRKALPARMGISPALAAMSSVTGPVTRFIHIWPYKSLDERARIRAKAVAEGIWPPPGGPAYLATQQTDIYVPAPFSPMR
jgi:hypothetical protein